MDMIDPNVDISLLKQNKFNSIYKNKLLNKNIEDKKLKKACDDFESFFMQQLLDISLKNTKIAGNGVGSEIIKGLYTENISKVGGGALGISDILYKFLTDKR